MSAFCTKNGARRSGDKGGDKFGGLTCHEPKPRRAAALRARSSAGCRAAPRAGTCPGTLTASGAATRQASQPSALRGATLTIAGAACAGPLDCKSWAAFAPRVAGCRRVVDYSKVALVRPASRSRKTCALWLPSSRSSGPLLEAALLLEICTLLQLAQFFVEVRLSAKLVTVGVLDAKRCGEETGPSLSRYRSPDEEPLDAAVPHHKPDEPRLPGDRRQRGQRGLQHELHQLVGQPGQDGDGRALRRQQGLRLGFALNDFAIKKTMLRRIAVAPHAARHLEPNQPKEARNHSGGGPRLLRPRKGRDSFAQRRPQGQTKVARPEIKGIWLGSGLSRSKAGACTGQRGSLERKGLQGSSVESGKMGARFGLERWPEKVQHRDLRKVRKRSSEPRGLPTEAAV